MNRRSFFKSISLFAASIAISPLRGLPAKLNGGPIPPYKYLKDNRTVIINPEWASAPYEMVLLWHGAKIQDPIPFRFYTVEDGYNFISYCNAKQTEYNAKISRCARLVDVAKCVP